MKDTKPIISAHFHAPYQAKLPSAHQKQEQAGFTYDLKTSKPSRFAVAASSTAFSAFFEDIEHPNTSITRLDHTPEHASPTAMET
ncbi:MAG: hypothetical protein Q4B51_03660 [Coriobacteriaceae bacterium]|nr:hypothetical protein [Coriobacteriaceae bacterium]